MVIMRCSSLLNKMTGHRGERRCEMIASKQASQTGVLSEDPGGRYAMSSRASDLSPDGLPRSQPWRPLIQILLMILGSSEPAACLLDVTGLKTPSPPGLLTSWREGVRTRLVQDRRPSWGLSDLRRMRGVLWYVVASSEGLEKRPSPRHASAAALLPAAGVARCPPCCCCCCCCCYVRLHRGLAIGLVS